MTAPVAAVAGALVSDALAGLYYAFSIPLGLVNIVLNVIAGNQNSANVPQVPQPRAPREWYSQPRICSDPTVEVLQINFKLPLSVSSLGFQTRRVPCQIQAYYRDRNNNWIPMTDNSANPIQLNLTYSSVASWYTFHSDVYPIVATALQLRIKRTFDPQVGNNPYVVGVKETLIRRNVYNLESSTAAIEQQQDVIGNTLTNYVEPWPASDAIDDDPNTFWKSFPCPDPTGVVALYLDMRNPSGGPQLFDTVNIDPVYDGQNLNLYYSNDPAVGTMIISSVPLAPSSSLNTDWTLGRGLVDSSAAGTSNSSINFPVSFGPMVQQPVWIGVEWTPDFDAGSGPPDNPILFQVTPDDPSAAAADGQFWPIVYYDVGAGEITLEFTNGTTTHEFHQALSPALAINTPIQIVVGWNYNPSVVYMSVTTQGTNPLGTTTTSPASTLPTLITLDGEVGYADFRGMITATVIKMTPWSAGSVAFQANSSIYANPNPVLPDSNGNFPSTSLDNAIFAVDWTAQQFPIGGTHESWYENKTWTPIFANYITSKGNLYLPQVVNAAYLKLEFTNLTAEPYPVYDQGVQVSYDSFPVSVIQQSIDNRPGGLLGVLDGVLTLGADIVVAAAGAVNWLNPATVQWAINSDFGQVQTAVQVVQGPGIITNSIPNTAQANISGMYRSEQNSPAIYSRSMPNATFLAGQQVATIQGQPVSNQTMQSANDPTAGQVSNAFTPVVTTSKSNVLPQQGSDWWLFPGANFKLPALIMELLFGSTDVTTARGPSNATRVRFATTCVHRYDIKTVTLDAAIGYFAGISSISTYLRTYIASNDPLSFNYTRYDPHQFTYNNIDQDVTGPLTTAGGPYVLTNPKFLSPMNLDTWTPTGAWFWDATHGIAGDNAAGIVATGVVDSLLSEPVPVNPGDQLVISAWVAYYGAVSTSSGTISIGATGYHSGVSAGALTLTDPSSGNGHKITNPTGNIDGLLFQKLIGLYTVPGSGIDAVAVSLNVDNHVTAGTMYWNNVEINPATGIEGTVFLNAVTSSTFAKLNCNFSDSGLVRSDALWARADPLDTNINNLQLAYYVSTFPSVIPSGVWADTFAEWSDTTIEWGEPLAAIAINIDPNLIYQGNRALHFTRAAGAGNAGIISTQQTYFAPNVLARLSCVFLKTTANNNQITISLRRVSDGVFIHTETFTPTVGYWFTYQSAFFEIPDSTDQVYEIEFLATGDDADELYLSDLYTEIAGIRYFVQLGDSGAFLFDVTALRYGDSCTVTTTTPVNEFSLTVGIFSEDSWAYGAVLTPSYLK